MSGTQHSGQLGNPRLGLSLLKRSKTDEHRLARHPTRGRRRRRLQPAAPGDAGHADGRSDISRGKPREVKTGVLAPDPRSRTEMPPQRVDQRSAAAGIGLVQPVDVSRIAAAVEQFGQRGLLQPVPAIVDQRPASACDIKRCGMTI